MVGRKTPKVSAISWTVLADVVHRVGLPDPVRGHLELGAPLAPAGSGGGEAVVGAFDDEVVLERGEHVEEQPAAGCGGVDALGQGAQPDLAGLQVVGEGLEVAHRAAEPVQLGDHQRVAGPQIVQRLLKRRPFGEGAGGVVGEDLVAAGGGQRVGLGVYAEGGEGLALAVSPARRSRPGRGQS